MKLCRIGFALLLVLSFMMPMFSASAAEGVLDSPANVEQALSGLNGTQALKWEDFWVNSTYVAGKNGTISRTKVTSGTGLFAEYLSYDLTAFGTNAGSTDTQISLRDTSGKFGFKGNIAAGDRRGLIRLDAVIPGCHVHGTSRDGDGCRGICIILLRR